MTDAELVQKVLVRKPKLDESYVTAVAPEHKEYAIRHTNNDFLDENGEEQLPKPIIGFIADACEYGQQPSGLNSRSMGDVSYNFEMDYPSAMLRKLKPYRKVRW